jgi:hypothetical protein
MKKLLLLIVAIALYLHFFPNTEVNNFYNTQKEFVLEKISEMADTKVRLKAEKIYSDLEPKLEAFSKEEIIHLKEITSSRENVITFYNETCQKSVRDYIFHRKNQQKVCQAIAHYGNLI